MIDLSHEAMFDRFGDIMHEIPELAVSLRLFELEMRPAVSAGAFKFHCDRVTVLQGVRKILRPTNS